MEARSLFHPAPPAPSAPTAATSPLYALKSPVDLAKIGPLIERARLRRRVVVRKLCDLQALPSGRLSANERALIGDLLVNLLADCDDDLQREAAERLCALTETPAPLIHALSINETTALVLAERAAALPDWAYSVAAEANGVEVRRRLAARSDVPTAVADQLVGYGQLDVLQALAANEDAKLSPRAVDALVARSRLDADLQRPLLNRRELTPAQGFAMFWWLSPEGRKVVLNRFSVDRKIVQEALGDSFDASSNADAEDGGLRGLDPGVDQVLSLIERRTSPRRDGMSVDWSVIALNAQRARRSLSPEAGGEEIATLARLCGLEPGAAELIIADRHGQSLAVFAKAYGLPRTAFQSIIESPTGAGDAFSEPVKADLTALFDGLSRDYAVTALRYWSWSRQAGQTGLSDADRAERLYQSLGGV